MKLKGLEFRRPEDLVEILKLEGVRLSGSDWYTYGRVIATRFGHYGGLFYIPEWLVWVMARLIEGRPTATVLDPWAGIGMLIGALRDATQIKDAIAFSPNVGDKALASVLVPDAIWQVGDPIRLLEAIDRELDVVASVLPMNAKSPNNLAVSQKNGKTLELDQDLGNQILVSSSLKLSNTGVGLFVVPPSFFFSSRSVIHQLNSLGLGVEAAFALPPGSFAPYTDISTYLVVVRRSTVQRMFIAQLSGEQNTNIQIINNFREGTEGGTVELGRFIPPQSFRGLDALRIQEKYSIAEEEFGTSPRSLSDLATSINLGRNGDDFYFHDLDNSVFIPLIGNSAVITDNDELIIKKQNYIQVAIDPIKSYASFVAQFLNSEFGKEILAKSKSGSTIPRLNKKAVAELRVFLPDVPTQKRMMEIDAKIAAEGSTVLALQNELSELRRELWANPRTSRTIEERLTVFSQRLSGGLKDHTSKNLDEWFETLPFPLASILRTWQATPTQDFKTKYEHLLHFFEATAEFTGVVLLSAYCSNEAIFQPHKYKLNEALRKNHLSFERATFGTWKLVVEYLGKQTRDLLADSASTEKRAICAELFADSSLILPEVISRKELASVLSTTNKLRNDWAGHGGVVGQEIARARNELLVAELQKLREAMADTWSEIQLIYALYCRPRHGIFENEVGVLMGSNTEFLKETREMANYLDVERLYLSKKNYPGVLKLLPFIQVGASPQSAKNACYFYSRIDHGGERFVSYHFADNPEITGPLADAFGVIKLLTGD